MFPRWMHQILLYSALGLLVFSITSCGNAEAITYAASCNQKTLQELQGKKLALLLFRYDPYTFAGAEAVTPATAIPIAGYQKQQIITDFAGLFDVIDVSEDNAILQNRTPDLKNPAVIADIIQDAGADGAIMMTNSYAYVMGGSLVDKVVDGILSNILPESWVEKFSALRGPSSVEDYYFASNMTILDRNGNAAWNFYGKVSMMPTPFTGTLQEEIQEFGEGFAGLDPSDQTILRAMKRIIDTYTPYNHWLVQAGLDGSSRINYFTDYPKDRQVKSIAIFPAQDTKHVPSMRTIVGNQVGTVPENPAPAGLWDNAKAGKWGKFGEWPAAWAALKLVLAFGLLFFIFSRWLDRIRQSGKSNLDEAVGLLAAVFSLAFLVSFYQLLKAIF